MEEKNKKDEVNSTNNINDEVSSYENNGIKDYKFAIILLAVIALAALCMPLISAGVKKLEESNFIDNLFNKNDTVTPNDDKKDDNKLEIVNYDKSGANAPVLKSGMIPVRYNFIEKKWVKANSDNPSTNGWYNYSNSEWANAVLVRQNGTKTRDYYEKASPDTIINSEDILAFFVWIPRYKYSLVASTGIQQIDVVFEEKTATKTTGPNYITHPAFTFDGTELSGIWVGKFEATDSINSVTILPNKKAIVNQNISTMFNALQGFYSDIYGLKSDDSNIRLLKNTEWGAVTYLTNSKYGICKNNECTTISNYNYDYDSETGILSSTTSNVYGVYAMSGGVYEYVMGNNNAVIGSSGFDSVWMSENKKYYDLYTDGASTDYSRGILGDATKEFGPFDNGTSSWNAGSSFVDSTQPWFFRDINNIYSFSGYTGGAHYNVGVRISLS